MEAQSLSPDEIELLKKMGIYDKICKPAKVAKPKPLPYITVRLEDFSGTVTTSCLCCLGKTVQYVDYVKRKDVEGYAIRTVKQPSHQIKRTHVVDTINCALCQDERLFNYEKGDLIGMILALRKQLRKGEK
jgi:hypothetical protein